MEAAALQRLVGLLGLGLRGRLLVVGVERVRDAARRGKLSLALVASDASANSLDKVVPLLKAKGVHMVDGITTATLGQAVGREATAVIGIVDAQLARGIRGIIDAVRA